MTNIQNGSAPLSADIIVVGAGFAGLYLVHKFRSLGYSVIGVEAGSDVGGTWYWNRYPGARCDVESLQYSYSFSEELQQEWQWRERFAPQPEIHAYISHVADRFDLRDSFYFNTRVTAARFRSEDNRWHVATDTGLELEGRFCIMATGSLSVARTPEIEGLDNFTGAIYHTGRWPQNGVDFTGQRVGVIGTGSSAVQSIPEIAAEAEHLYVFQRTPNFSVPARNGPLAPEYEKEWKRIYPAHREKARNSRSAMLFEYGTKSALETTPEERAAEFARRWERGGLNFLYAYTDTIRDEQANEYSAEYVRQRIAETVKDPETAARLMPRSYPIGTKRLCVENNYYETFNRDNVTLVDVNAAPITHFSSTRLCTAENEYPLHAIVFATGFDAMTGALLNIDIVGEQGSRLRDKWREGPRTYLGLAIAGFPNLFTVNGPGSPSVLTNMVMSIEHHVDWIVQCITTLDERGATRIEADLAAENQWVAHVNEVAAPTLYSKAASWFMGANIPGKPRVFMPYVGGFHVYTAKCEEVAEKGYEGFIISR